MQVSTLQVAAPTNLERRRHTHDSINIPLNPLHFGAKENLDFSSISLVDN